MENEPNKCSRCGKTSDNVEFATEKRCQKCADWNTRNNPNRNDSFKKKYPAPDKCVYAFYEGEECVYVGESMKASDRIYYHMNYGHCTMHIFDPDTPKEEKHKKYTYKILWEGDNDLKRKMKEDYYIKLHQPKFNKQYKQYKDE